MLQVKIASPAEMVRSMVGVSTSSSATAQQDRSDAADCSGSSWPNEGASSSGPGDTSTEDHPQAKDRSGSGSSFDEASYSDPEDSGIFGSCSPTIKGKRSSARGANPKNSIRSAFLGVGINYVMLSAFVNGQKGRKAVPTDMVKTSVEEMNLVQVISFRYLPCLTTPSPARCSS